MTQAKSSQRQLLRSTTPPDIKLVEIPSFHVRIFLLVQQGWCSREIIEQGRITMERSGYYNIPEV